MNAITSFGYDNLSKRFQELSDDEIISRVYDNAGEFDLNVELFKRPAKHFLAYWARVRYNPEFTAPVYHITGLKENSDVIRPNEYGARLGLPNIVIF